MARSVMEDVMKTLWKSRKFKAVVLDVATSLALYFSARFLAPEIVGDIKFVIGAIQPVIGLYIWGVAYEDGQMKRNGGLTLPIE